MKGQLVSECFSDEMPSVEIILAPFSQVRKHSQAEIWFFVVEMKKKLKPLSQTSQNKDVFQVSLSQSHMLHGKHKLTAL